MTKPNSKIVEKALLAHCLTHQPVSDLSGLDCDERGCMICNAGATDAAFYWWEAYLAGEMELPFDPEDTEEMFDLIHEMNCRF